MNILIIDDNDLNIQSARQTLAGHNVTTVSTHDEAIRLLMAGSKWNPQTQLEEHGHHGYEVVLCDLLMPAGKKAMGPKGKEFIGQEMPVGLALSLIAALHGASHVAVATATNHHDHPASAMIDPIESNCESEYRRYSTPPKLTINGARVGYYHAPMISVNGTTCPKCEGKGAECRDCMESGKLLGKDWDKILRSLLSTGIVSYK